MRLPRHHLKKHEDQSSGGNEVVPRFRFFANSSHDLGHNTCLPSHHLLYIFHLCLNKLPSLILILGLPETAEGLSHRTAVM